MDACLDLKIFQCDGAWKILYLSLGAYYFKTLLFAHKSTYLYEIWHIASQIRVICSDKNAKTG